MFGADRILSVKLFQIFGASYLKEFNPYVVEWTFGTCSLFIPLIRFLSQSKRMVDLKYRRSFVL